MYCPKCGKQNDENAYKCTGCQTVLHPSANPVVVSGGDDALKYLVPIGRSGLAITAGYLGIFSMILIPAPLAILFGALALADIKKHPDKSGKGRAIFGIVAGIIGSIILIVLIIDSFI